MRINEAQAQDTAVLLDGSYLPQVIRWVKLPKPNGGVRVQGIPTVVDRFTQQAIQQRLTPYYEPEFSESSHGFKPGRNARKALCFAKPYVRWRERTARVISMNGVLADMG